MVGTDTLEQANLEAQEYVPDVRCPECAQFIHLPIDTYQWYDGNIPCGTCYALLYIPIGDFRQSTVWDGMEPTTHPFRGGQGGKLLAEPKVVRPPVKVPPVFLQAAKSELIGSEAHRHMELALRHYADGTYRSSILACRTTIQMALLDCRIPDATPSRMVDEAKQLGLLDAFGEYCCRMINRAGGDAAHAAESPDGPREALAVIGAAVTVLGRLYAVPR